MGVQVPHNYEQQNLPEGSTYLGRTDLHYAVEDAYLTPNGSVVRIRRDKQPFDTS